MRRLFTPLLLALALLASGTAAFAQTSPFGRGTPSTSTDRKADAPSPATVAPPGLFQRWFNQLQRWQVELTRQLATEVRAYKENGELAPVLGILLISFLYGVGHAAGPGHGKAASAAYFGANRALVKHGIAMSALIGAVQALSAVVFVGAFALIFKLSQTQTVRSVLYVEIASYALIAMVGLWIAWGGVVGRGCTHDHSGLGARGKHDHAHDDDHGHYHGHDHAHHHGHAHDHGPAQDHGHAHNHAHHGHAHAHIETKPMAGWRTMLPVALASGIRPCTGAILILLFTLTQGIFAIGVLATLVMSIGTFLVVAAIGLVAIYARRAASRAGAGSERLANTGQRAVSLAGGLIVFGFGALFLLGSLAQMGVKI
jgi:ABC-type nickel/cobalt efflux system permease component RcnA